MLRDEDYLESIQMVMSPIAHDVVLLNGSDEERGALAKNRNLSPQLWERFYSAYCGAEDGAADLIGLQRRLHVKRVRGALLASASNAELARRILAESDPEVFEQAIRAGIMNLDEAGVVELIGSPFFNRECVISLVRSKYKLSTQVLDRLWDMLDWDLTSKAGSALRNEDETLYAFLSQGLNIKSADVIAAVGMVTRWESVAPFIELMPGIIDGVLAEKLKLGNDIEGWYRNFLRSRYVTSNIASGAVEYVAKRISGNRDPQKLNNILEAVACSPWITPRIRLDAVEVYINRKYTRSEREFFNRGVVLYHGKEYTRWADLGTALAEAVVVGEEGLGLFSSVAELSYAEQGDICRWVERGSSWNDQRGLAKLLGFKVQSMHSIRTPPKNFLSIHDERYLDALGERGWLLFINIANGWEGSVSDLLAAIAGAIV